MKNLKKLPTPLKVFITISITMLLLFLTWLVMMPFQFIYEFSDHVWDIITIITGSIYLITTGYFMFSNSNNRL